MSLTSGRGHFLHVRKKWRGSDGGADVTGTMAKRRKIKFGRPAPKRKAKTVADALRGRRLSLLYGLTGLFGVVVSGLVLARPHPLQAQAAAIAPDVVLLATNANHSNDPLDAALQTGSKAKPGHWTGVTVLRLTTTQARVARAHFKVVLEDGAGAAPQIVVGAEWLQQVGTPSDPKGQFVLVVVVDDHEREVRHQAPVVALVDRLCQRLRIDPGTVRWS